MTEFRKLSSDERQAKAKAIAESYLDQTGNAGKASNQEMVERGFEGLSPQRKGYLDKMAGRFAQAMVARLIDIDSKLTEEDLKFMFKELFLSLHVMKPFEMIAAFKMVGDWCGFSSIPVRALKLPQGRFPVLKFSKVGS